MRAARATRARRRRQHVPDRNGRNRRAVIQQLDLSGTPKYYRAIRLSNQQWAQAVQTVLNVPSGGLEATFETPATGMTDFTNSEMVLGFDARNWQDFQAASETLAAQVTATDTALAKVYSGTDPAGSSRRWTSRLPPPADGGRAGDVPGALQQGLVADGNAQHVRQGRVAGHPRDAAVAVFPVPDRARGEGRAAQQLRDGGEAVPVAAGNGPGRQDARSGGGLRQARHRGRRGGAGHHDARRGGGHERSCASSTANGCTSTSYATDLQGRTSRPTRPR